MDFCAINQFDRGSAAGLLDAFPSMVYGDGTINLEVFSPAERIIVCEVSGGGESCFSFAYFTIRLLCSQVMKHIRPTDETYAVCVRPNGIPRGTFVGIVGGDILSREDYFINENFYIFSKPDELVVEGEPDHVYIDVSATKASFPCTPCDPRVYASSNCMYTTISYAVPTGDYEVVMAVYANRDIALGEVMTCGFPFLKSHIQPEVSSQDHGRAHVQC